jgi:putative ABC transport system permease protein
MILEFRTMLKIMSIVLISGLIAGLYPAIHLSSLSPLSLLKEDFKHSGKRQRSGYLRSVLIVFQYIISIVALISAFTVLRQLNFVKKTDLGFVKDNILTVSLKDPVLRKNPEVLIAELKSNPQITETCASSVLPVTISSNSSGNWPGKPLDLKRGIYRAGIGKNFIGFYNLKIVAGRGFSDDYPADTINRYIINETTAKMVGWNDPIGHKFGINNNMGIVIGVVKDFYFHSLRLKIEPLAISVLGSDEYTETSYISVKVNPGTLNETRFFVEKKLKELSPDYLNSVSLLSDRVDTMYSSDRQLAAIFIFSTLLAFILTCLGLYGLSSYTTKSRTREMVIRKVMGSQPNEIMALLTGEMARWILVSIIFAWPIAYFLMTKWLQNFAYHIDIGAGVFIISLIISLAISVIAISYHVIKLSRVNPAEMIRYD